MKRLLISMLAVLMAVYLVGACAPVSVIAPTPAMKEGKLAPKADWQQKWENVLNGAKKEGTITIYTSLPAKPRVDVTEFFRGKYGISAEFLAFSGASELVSRVLAEKRAGIYNADVFASGWGTLTAKQEGILGSLESLLILPDVIDPNVWLGGKLPFVDKEGLHLAMVGPILSHVFYNTTLVKEGELKSVRDLLNPKYKGKITFHDPTVIGGGNTGITHLGTDLWGEAETIDFLTRLLKEQEPLIQRDYRIQIESVARGKFAIGLYGKTEFLAEFIDMGAPVKAAMIEEATKIGAGGGGLSVSSRPPHPDATTVFVNGLLTREGQSLFAKSFSSPSTRVDASTEGVNPIFIPVPGKRYYGDTEETPLASTRWLGIAKKIIAETTK